MNGPAEDNCRARRGLAAQLLSFMSDYRKWWLLPILAVLLVLAILVATGGNAITPFLYARF